MKRISIPAVTEELTFYKKIIDNSPIFLSINQLDNPDNPETNHNIWLNRFGKEFIGYDQNEIEKLGVQFFLETMHPDDLELIANAVAKFDKYNLHVFGGLVRLRPKNNSEYSWCLGSIIVFEVKDGKPWRYLVAAQNIDHMKDTQNQITALIRENLKLKNTIKLNALTKRELQVVRLISESKTDKEVANELIISLKTAKTHRHNILNKLGLKNATALVRFALENGIC